MVKQHGPQCLMCIKSWGPPPKILEDQPEYSVKMDVFSCKKEMRDLRGRTSSLEVQVSVMKNFPDLSGLCSQKLCRRIQEGDVVVKNISRVIDLFLDLYQVVDRHEVLKADRRRLDMASNRFVTIRRSAHR